MKDVLKRLLAGEFENHIMPFFWQHGEDEATLREYMKVMDEANCKAVCVESRPHPDFCGPKWWEDMDVILDEARKRGMKVWILDDSHFPTGLANGEVKNAPIELHRQSICKVTMEVDGPAGEKRIDLTGMIPGEYKFSGQMEQYVLPMLLKDSPHYEDDHAIAVTAVSEETKEVVYGTVTDNEAVLEKPEGKVKIYVIGLSRNMGPHRDFINMLNPDSCRILIDAVYEKHYAHYKEDFGKTIEGFFSDEPELGNGHLYFYDNLLGTDQDLPFSENLPAELEKTLGKNWANRLYLLWENGQDKNETAFVRYTYMDAVTRLVRDSFSYQLGNWCRERGVRYIGHMIEDSNAHARTGSSLGHYFRGLQGQDMAGIDDIGGQVLPQGENEPVTGVMGAIRDGEFYHYQLANLAASAAAIEPGKAGNSMCEIFGNYGWAEGTRLEKYLADHFMVNGINHFVPHAFSPAPFPDIDCPPHFYAQGHNPEYRAFGEIMAYMNRVSTLISGGRRCSQAAVLYHGESEWSGKSTLTQKAIRCLLDAQIVADTIPADVFRNRAFYQTKIADTLQVNQQTYEVFILPEVEFITRDTAIAVNEMLKKGMHVFAVASLPTGICDEEDEQTEKALIERTKGIEVVALEELVSAVEQRINKEISIEPAETYIRALHYDGKVNIFYLVNEGKEAYTGTIYLKDQGKPIEEGYLYDAYLNKVYPLEIKAGGVQLTMLPLHSYIIVADQAEEVSKPLIDLKTGKWILDDSDKKIEWKELVRGTCEGIRYPFFEDKKAVAIPDRLAEEQPEFSGFVSYEETFDAKFGQRGGIYIEDAYEAVEVFLNEKSLGIQIVPPFVYDFSDVLEDGINHVRIEVATTLERYCYELVKDDIRSVWRGVQPPACGSGITGKVYWVIQ